MLVLSIICILELLVISMLGLIIYRSNDMKMNIEDYEIILLSICRTVIRTVDVSDIEIDEVCEEIRDIFYNELENEDIKIDNKLDNLTIKDYIKNMIYINNLISETDIKTPEVSDSDDLDVPYNKNSSYNENYVSTLSTLNNFYD